ncbi:MAG: hypothetical protein U0Z26_10560 [Anaerolineales bacterium]
MPTKKTTKKSEKRIKNPIGDTITIKGVGAGAAVAAGRNASASIVSTTGAFEKWTEKINKKIDALTLSQNEKGDLKRQIEEIKNEINKGSKAEKSRLEKLINTLSVMSGDIFEVAVTTLQNPLAGIGLVITKINDRIKLEKSK